MPESAAIHSYNATLTRSTTETGTYTALGEVVDIEWDSGDVPVSDVTHLQSPNAMREKQPKLIDVGEITFMINFVKGQYNTLFTDWKARTRNWFKLNTPDGSVLGPFRAWIKKLPIKVPDDDRVTSSITLTINYAGTATFTPG